ncbi:hypothetical protein D3C87_1897510 [compost metagenome]
MFPALNLILLVGKLDLRSQVGEQKGSLYDCFVAAAHTLGKGNHRGIENRCIQLIGINNPVGGTANSSTGLLLNNRQSFFQAFLDKFQALRLAHFYRSNISHFEYPYNILKGPIPTRNQS